jgi:type IV secretory pathway VirB3-like protein
VALSDYQDTLYVTLTRPMMYWGVPIEGLWLNGIIWYLAYFLWGQANLLTLHGIEAALLGPFVHVLMSIGIAYDPNIFRLIFLWVDTRHVQPRRVSVLWAARWWKARNADEMAWGAV